MNEGASVSFGYSGHLQLNLAVKILSLEGYREPPSLSTLVESPEARLQGERTGCDIFVSVQLFADGKPLSLPVRTCYKSFKPTTSRKWNEWVEIPTEYSILPYNSVLAITVWERILPNKQSPYGGTIVKLFDDHDSLLKTGRQRLVLTPNKEADVFKVPTSSLTLENHIDSTMDRLEKCMKKHETGEIQHIDWLDKMTFRRIESINKQAADIQRQYLFIELPQFSLPIVYSEPVRKPQRRNVHLHYSGPTPYIIDPELGMENLVEAKHKRLARKGRSGPFDHELKPSPEAREELNAIMNLPPGRKLENDEQELVWKFRYYLTRYKKALTKFLETVVWDDASEVKQVGELLSKWTEIDIDDALELLGPNFDNKAVRAYAVDRLRKASDLELELYLLQLVEALKFECEKGKQWEGCRKSPLAMLLIGRTVRNEVLSDYFYHYITVSAEDGGSFTRMYKDVKRTFLYTLKERPDGSFRMDHLKLQGRLIAKLLILAKGVQNSRLPRPKKIEHLIKDIGDPKTGLVTFPVQPLFLDPTVLINGVIPDECLVFKSSLVPLRIVFKRADEPGTYPIIFKSGDDLRQDQLVVQIIRLMDRLLRQENLDLKLTPYKVLATGSTDGALQFIPGMSLAAVMSEYHSVNAYLEQHNPDVDAPMKIKPEVMDTFVKSCAGYCVITYILGVGDRHLDNLMVSPDGRFFHIDFGYILGHDPKPFAPLMKLPIQLIEAMGNVQSENYSKFCNYCFTAYTILRKSANLILNLFALMKEANIPDIRMEPDRAVSKVKDKFCLDMSEEEAIVHFQNLINGSVSAFVPKVIDRLHNFTQYWRA